MKKLQISVPVEQEQEDEDESGDWRYIIFLPFQTLWETSLMISVFVNVTVSVFVLVFQDEKRVELMVIHYICELMYLLDTILTILHINMVKIRKVKSYIPRSLASVVIDVISLLPIFEVSYFITLTDYNVGAPDSKNYWQWKVVIRVYRILVFSQKLKKRIGLNQLVVLTLNKLVRLALFGQLNGALMYAIKNRHDINWTNNVHDYNLGRNDPVDWWRISTTMMTCVFANNWSSSVIPMNNEERLIFLGTMALGCVFHMTMYLGSLIMVFKKLFQNYFEYESKIKRIMELLEQWEVGDDLKKKTSEYYTTFFKRRQGMVTMPPMFNLIPPSLQKEVTVDIFWEALRHSHFFSATDMSFKRSVSLVMKSEFLLPGEFLFRIDELKEKMVYLVSGIIQILSPEDDDSPILSFSSGTVLAEVACFLPLKSAANIRAVTYCEIQTLYYQDLHRVLLNYPLVRNYFRHHLSNRLVIAVHNAEKRRHHMAHKISGYESTESTIKLLKEQWNIINKFAKNPEHMPPHKEGSFHCHNLDMLVLSEDVELRVESICLTGRCPFIMDPQSTFRSFCNYVVIAAIVLQSVIIPKAAFFDEKMSHHDISICLLLDAVYCIDIYLQASTAIELRNRLITDFKKLLMIRLKQFTFLVDIVATFPADYIILLAGVSSNLGMYKLPRLLMIYKIFRVLRTTEENISFNTLTIRCIKYISLFSVTGYWYTCITYEISKMGNAEWKTVRDELYQTDSLEQKIWDAIITTLSAYVGYVTSTFSLYFPLLMIWVLALTIAGVVVGSFACAELIATDLLRQQDSDVNKVQWWALNNDVTRHKLDTDLKNRLARFLYFHHTVKGCQVVGDHSTFIDAPAELRNEIVRHRIIDCLMKVQLFQGSKREMLKYLCAHAEIKLVPAKATLMSSDNKSEILYVIMRGYCKMFSTLPGDLEREATRVLQSGDTFPFLETLHDCFSFVNVFSMTVVELLLIRTSLAVHALKTFEGDYICFRNALAEHKAIYGSVLFRKGARLPQMRSKGRAMGKGKTFEYEIFDEETAIFDNRAYLQPFLRLGTWSFVRYFLFKKTILPTSWFFIIWETFRCITIMLVIVIVVLKNTVIFEFNEYNYPLYYMLLDVIGFVDIYLRMHCQYYDKKGILVSHPLYTTKNYIHTSFFVDLLSVVQIYNLALHKFLGQRFKLWLLCLGLILTKTVQMYRPFALIDYMNLYYKSRRKSLFTKIKYVTLSMVVLSTCAVISMLVMCNHKGYRIYCTDNMFDLEGYDALFHFVYHFYTIAVCLTHSGSGTVIKTLSHLIFTVIILLAVLALKWIFIVNIMSNGIGGNVELTIYRDRVKSYWEFLRNGLISNEDKQSIVIHYEYVWKKTNGMEMHDVIRMFHLQLQQDIASSLYIDTLDRTELFVGEHVSFYKTLSPRLRQEYYTKDSKIIQCNDVQSKLFFVHEGAVDIYIANTYICTLHSGGVFGCFTKKATIRQTIKAVAKIHSMMLTTETKALYAIVEFFPKINDRLSKANAMNYEYMQELRKHRKRTSESMSSRHYLQYRSFYKKMLNYERSNSYKYFDYITNVHIYPMSSIFILSTTFGNLYELQTMYITALYYILDAIHFVKMCVKFHLIYVDTQSGRIITDPSAIRSRYVKSTFWFDFITLLPFEFVAGCYTQNRVFLNLCFLNRTLRFAYLVTYYYRCEQSLSMKQHLKWTYMIYTICFQLQIFVCLWLLVACPYTLCTYWVGFENDKDVVTRSNDTLESTILAYLYVMTLYTGTGLKSVVPVTLNEIAISTLIMIVGFCLITNVCSNFTSHMMVNTHVFHLYEVNFHKLWGYLQNRELSPFLCSKVWAYCLRLWRQDRGKWLPALITESPPYLKENVMVILYGRHLRNHFLFCETHVDFLRQVVVHFERYVFAVGDSIVETGDADCCMYFINTGEIFQFQMYGKIERKVGTLTAGCSFGEVQGLMCAPHTHSYRANRESEILILNKNKWGYLMTFFPASKEQIWKKTIESGLVDEETMAHMGL